MSDSETGALIAEIRQAAQLLRSGRRGEALVIYHDVSTRAERRPAVQLQLGHLCEEFGDIDQAVSHYEIVAEEEPDVATHHATLGIAYLNAQELDKAHDTLERALEIDADIAEVQHGLGVYHIHRADYARALEYLERACKLKPGDASIRINLSSTLAKRNRHDEALRHINRALKSNKSDLGAHLTLCDILAQVGDIDASTREVELLLRKHPHSGAAYDLLARNKKFTDEDSALMKRAEKALDRGMAPNERYSLQFALGKMYDDCARYDDAFKWYEQANLLQKKHYDVDGDDGLRKALARAFTADSIAAFGEHGNASRLPVFVVGMPRSGTTLIERIIASHPQGAGAGELPAIPILAHNIFPAAERRRAATRAEAELTPEKIGEHTDTYLSILRQADESAERIVDKMPGNSRFLGLIKALFPNATIIHSIRHPLDTCLSCYFQNFADLRWANDLKLIGEVYDIYRKSMDHWYDVLPEGSILDVRYEELVEDPETHARRMIEACGLEWDSSVLEFYRKKGVVRTASIAQTRQPIYKTSRQRWMNYADRLAALVNELGPYLEGEAASLREHGLEPPSKPGFLKRLMG